MKNIEELIGNNGAMIHASKFEYKQENPNNEVCFNGNVCTDEGKIWWGDIDVTKKDEGLQTLANQLGKTVYVLCEMDGRFDNEAKPLLENAVRRYDPK